MPSQAKMASRYDGFISYSHSADGKLAPALQRAFQSLARPWYRLRALHVFRDETSLSANPALWTSIEKALSESRWFIYLASPGAAASPWVRREIQWWLANRDLSSLLIGLTEGTIKWDGEKFDFDWEATDAVPRELSGRFSSEPLWVDVSWARGLDNLSIRHSQFRSAVLRLAAPLHGQAPDQLDGEDVREYRRARRTATGAIVALVLLTVASVAAAYFAVQRGRESVSRELAMHSIQQLDPDPELSVRLALHAVESAATEQAEDALRRALGESKVFWTVRAPSQVATTKHSPTEEIIALASSKDVALIGSQSFRVLGHPALTANAEFTRDGRLIATSSADGKARVWEVASGKLVSEMQASPERFDQIAFTADGSRLVTVGFSVHDRTASEIARVWDTTTGRLMAELKGHTGAIAAEGFDPAGKRVVTGSWDGTVRIWDASTGALLRTLTHGRQEPVGAVIFSPDGRSVLSGTRGLSIRRWNVTNGAITADGGDKARSRSGYELELKHFVLVSADTSRVLTYDGVRASIYDGHTAKALRDLADFPSSCPKAVFSHDARLIACPGGEGAAFVWDVETGVRIAAFRGHRGELNDVAFRPDNRALLTSGTDNTARAWVIEAVGGDLTLQGHNQAVTTAVWSGDGRLVATAGADMTARVWDAQTGAAVAVMTGAARLNSLAFSTDGQRLLVAAYEGGQVFVRDARNANIVTVLDAGQPEAKLDDEESLRTVDGVVILAATQRLPTVETEPGKLDLDALGAQRVRGTLHRWEEKSGRKLAGIEAGEGRLGERVMCGYARAPGLACVRTENEAVSRIWDIRTGAMIAELKDHLAPVGLAAMSIDGRLIAFSDQKRVEIWDLRSGQIRARIAERVTSTSPRSTSTPMERGW